MVKRHEGRSCFGSPLPKVPSGLMKTLALLSASSFAGFLGFVIVSLTISAVAYHHLSTNMEEDRGKGIAD